MGKSSSSLRQQWRDAVRDTTAPGIDAHTIAVAMALDRHMSADGRTHTAVRTLATLARVSKNTVTDRITRLETAGLLDVQRPRNGGSSTYQATLPTDPDRPTLWDTYTDETVPPHGTPPSHPVGHSPNGSVPPGDPKRPTPRDKPSHPVGLTPYDPGTDNPEGGAGTRPARAPHRNGTHRPPSPLATDPLTVDALAVSFAYHLTTRGQADPDEITDHVHALLTHLRPTTTGPAGAMVELALRLDDLPDTHRRRWARELATDLEPSYTPTPPPRPWT